LPKTGPKLYFKLLGNLLSSQPYSVASHFTSAFQRAVQGELASSSYDLVLCEWTPYAQFVREFSDVPRVVVAHNVEHQIWQRYVENETQLLVRWYLGLQARRMRAFEENVFSSVEGATAVSAADAATIKSMAPHLDVEVVDNGVDLEFFADDSEPADTAAPTLVFTGSMDWRPNQDSVEYFVNDILPLVQAEQPDVQTVFVGRNPPPKIADLGKLDGVTITGTVDDVRPYIREAAVYIVPLRIGGGSRLKILEALAMKKPVVSTGVGAEGLDITDGRELLLADTPQQFARQINLLLSDRSQARKLGEAGRKLVERRYGWDALAAKLEQCMTRLVAAK
jgi:sugar transferase (PEP-CTERM/EpsH1 system associated)